MAIGASAGGGASPMLALFVLFAVAALWSAGFLNSLEPEDDTIDALREARPRPEWEISVHDTPALVQRRRGSPNFWFVVRDGRDIRFRKAGCPRICRNRRRP
jgi:hypothetical protein